MVTLSRCLHIASAGASCSPLRCLPIKKKNPQTLTLHHPVFVLHAKIGQNTHRDICVQWFAVVSHILLSNIQHVNLRTGDHDPNQGFVFSPSPLNMLDSTSYNWTHTRGNSHPNQNVGSYLHGLVKSLCKVARSVFNTLDWNKQKKKRRAQWTR